MGYKVRIGRTDGDSLVRNRLCLAQVSGLAIALGLGLGASPVQAA